MKSMYKLCKTEQSAQRQRQIEAALLEMMGTKCYDDITVSDLCGQMGVPRKAFYRYFSGKDGALHGLIDHRLLDFALKTALFSGVEIQQMLCAFFRFWLEQKPLLDALERSALSGVLVDRVIANTRQAYAESAVGKPEPPGNIRPYTITFGLSGLMNMVLQWHRDGYRESVSQMAQMAAQLLPAPLIRLSEQ